MKYTVTSILLVLLALLAACGGQQAPVGADGSVDLQLTADPLNLAGPVLEQIIPQDSLLPWESLNEDGFVDPATARMSSAINENSEFWRGVDAFGTEGTTSNFGQALRLESGSAGAGGRSIATYRIPLGGENPATLSTDINLRLRSDGSTSEFYIGIANYGSGRWDWSGPFSDGRIRLPVDEAASGDYISGLGNAFITVVAYSGSSFDIVGISLNQFDPGDLNAPPVPTGLSVTPVAGGLELQWNSVLAGDLAGYRVHWSSSSFANPNAVGVKQLAYLEGGTRHVLSGLGGTTFVAVCAVDLSGNASAISGLESAAPLGGNGPVVELETDSASGIVNDNIALSASGADSYDWDLDGDGVFEITADLTGNQLADTGQAGIIRPAVRASSGGTAVALGAVSLIVASDLPPVAILTANRTGGAIIDGESGPLNVNFSAANSYDDGGSLDFAWSLLGDGNWTAFSGTDTNSQGYSSSGIYNAAMRCEDGAGQQAYAILPIAVEQVTGFRYKDIWQNPAGVWGTIATVEGRPAIAFRWFGGPGKDGLFYSRALDDEGRLWGNPVPISTFPDMGDFADMAIIAGHPAIVYNNPNVTGFQYRRASSPTGQTLLDWGNAPVTLETPVFPSEEFVLAEVDNNPAVIWWDGGAIKYKRATSAAGTGNTAGDWADPGFTIVAANADVRPDLAVIDGNPAIAWHDNGGNEAHYLRATTSSGSSALDWPAVGVKVSGPDLATGRVCLAEVNGAPAISYYESGISGLKYVRATTSTGNMLADWPLGLIIDEDYSQGNQWHDLAMVGGRPAIAYSDFEVGSHTSYRRANNANGSSWGEEWRVAPQSDLFHSAYERIELADLNGFPALYVYYQSYDRPGFATFNTEL